MPDNIGPLRARLNQGIHDRNHAIPRVQPANVPAPGTAPTPPPMGIDRSVPPPGRIPGFDARPNPGLRPGLRPPSEPPAQPPATTPPAGPPPVTPAGPSLLDRVRERLDRAGWRFWKKDDEARAMVRELGQQDLTGMGRAAENELLAPMIGPGFWPILSADDEQAIAKLYATETSDADYYEATATLRDASIRALGQSATLRQAGEKWAQWDTPARLAALQEAADIFAQATGLPRKAIATFTEGPRQIDGTEYLVFGYAKSGTIHINTHASALEDFQRVLTTVLHESQHLFQHATTEMLGSDPIVPGTPLYEQVRAFSLNHQYYVDGSSAKSEADFLVYQNQPVETDARRVAGEIVAGLRDANRRWMPTSQVSLSLNRQGATLGLGSADAEVAEATRLSRTLETSASLPMVIERQVEVNGTKVTAQCQISIPRDHEAFPLAVRDFLARGYGLTPIPAEGEGRAARFRLAPIVLPHR